MRRPESSEGGIKVTAKEIERMMHGFPCTPKFMRLPLPSYVIEAISTSGSEKVIKWIGFEAESLDGDKKKFIWAYNVSRGNLKTGNGRLRFAELIAVKKLNQGMELSIGPAVDDTKSDSKNDRVEVITKPGQYGIYVEEESRPGYNFKASAYDPRVDPNKTASKFGSRYGEVLSQALVLLRKN